MKRYYWLILLIILLGATAALALSFFTAEEPDQEARVMECYLNNKNDSEKINCWFSLIREVFIDSGTKEAFILFEHIYNKYDTFSNTGCHRHAHRVGDLSYYYDYLQHQDLAKTEFPANAVACGYGFYHGFFEHLIQDNPDPQFVTRTCKYLSVKIIEVAPAISQTCYHGAGHGFVLALVDRSSQENTWSPNFFAKKPLEQCSSLEDANEAEISECRQGVFNVIADWMADKEYTSTYDLSDPFGFCDSLEFVFQEDCYYEMAQKIGLIAGLSPLKAAAAAATAARSDLEGLILDVAVAGMVQSDPKGDQQALLVECRQLPMELAAICLKAIIGGLIEHTTANQDFNNVLDFCASEELLQTERELCYSTLAYKLNRFYSKMEIVAACQVGRYPELLCLNI